MLRSVSLLVLMLSLALFMAAGCNDDDPLTVVTGRASISNNPGTLDAPWILHLPGGLIAIGSGNSSVSDLPTGQYSLEWQDIEGWRTPTPNPVSKFLASGATISFSGTYAVLDNEVGVINIDAGPDAVESAITWTLNGPNAFLQEGSADLVLEDMPVGEYQLVWDTLTDYLTPEPQTLTLVADENITFQTEYVFKTASIKINPVPIDAGWHLEGPSAEYTRDDSGDHTYEDFIAAEYTVTWNDAPGYLKPKPETLHLSDYPLTFTGIYTLNGAVDDFIALQGDTFTMGSAADESGRDSDEGQHDVTLTHDFFMQATEVTNQQYRDMLQWAYDRGIVYVPTSEAYVYDSTNLACDVVVTGDKAYVVDDEGLLIFDVANPENPELLGVCNTPGSACGVAVSGSYAYVADSKSGLQVINISNPANPTLAGGYDTPGVAVKVVLDGTIAYVADSRGGLQAIDISTPGAPGWAGSYDTPGLAQDIAIIGNIAYVADGESGLQLIDITNPASMDTVSTFETIGYAMGVAVEDTVAYIAGRDRGLEVLSVNAPAEIYTIMNLDLADWAQKIRIESGLAYLSNRKSGMQIINISQPDSVYALGVYDTPGQSVNVDVQGDYVYVADWEGGFFVLDASALYRPVMAGSYDTMNNRSFKLLELKSIFCNLSYSEGQFTARNPEKPMITVTWYGAAAYCDWMNMRLGYSQVYDHTDWSPVAGDIYLTPGYRLPTEAEWEFACRAGQATPFNTGQCLDSRYQANYDGMTPLSDDCPVGITPELDMIVGSYGANDWGLADMHGNVFEWCYDGYVPYATGAVSDPVGVGAEKIVRGGSWGSPARICRSANRYAYSPGFLNRFVGFRVVR